jgi:hypothetical protein
MPPLARRIQARALIALITALTGSTNEARGSSGLRRTANADAAILPLARAG